MSEMLPDLFPKTNPQEDHVVGISDQSVGAGDQLVGFHNDVRLLCRTLWLRKSAYQLAIAADVTVRQAERLLAGQQDFSLAVFRRLLQGEHGDRFLAVLMAGSSAAWWKDVAQERQISELKRRKRELERELKALDGGAA